MQLRYSRRADNDLFDLAEYIAQDDVGAALRTRDEIERQVEHLKAFPDMGRAGRIAGTRELLIAGLPYIVIYREQRSDTIEIVRVLHGAQQWPAG